MGTAAGWWHARLSSEHGSNPRDLCTSACVLPFAPLIFLSLARLATYDDVWQNVAITTKAGLLGNLRNLKWFADCDSGDILPRGYDLSVETDVLVRNGGEGQTQQTAKQRVCCSSHDTGAKDPGFSNQVGCITSVGRKVE